MAFMWNLINGGKHLTSTLKIDQNKHENEDGYIYNLWYECQKRNNVICSTMTVYTMNEYYASG